MNPTVPLELTLGGRAGRSRRGFTLLEILVTIVILVVLVGLMGKVFNDTHGMLLFASETLEAEQTGRALLQQMATELTHAIASPGFALSSSSNSVTFFAAVTPRTTNSLCELRKIRYELQATPPVFNGLQRSEKWCGSSGWPMGADDGSTTVAQNQITELSFECASVDGAFSSSWSSNALPAAVRIRIALVGSRTAAKMVTMGGENARLRDEYLVRLSSIVALRNASLE